MQHNFWGWIERPISQNLVLKCSYVDDTIEGGLWSECNMQWMEINKKGNN
jgi:hypothetical protein